MPKALADIPAVIFAEELLSAYPDAKVILTVRDEERWKKSMEETIWRAWVERKPETATTRRKMAEAYHKYLWNNDFPKHGVEYFQKHNELVKQKTAPERLLVYEVKEGWGPLCKFLGKETPTVEFPRKDQWVEFKKELFPQG